MQSAKQKEESEADEAEGTKPKAVSTEAESVTLNDADAKDEQNSKTPPGKGEDGKAFQVGDTIELDL